MPMQRDRYPPDWDAISRRIRERAGWRCERCGVENGAEVLGSRGTTYRVVLTVAHVGPTKHDKMDCRDEVLLALCQRDHLTEDREDHLRHAAENRRRAREEAGQLTLWRDIPCETV